MNRFKSFTIRLAALFLVSSGAAALDIHDWTTENGVRVLFVESHDLPMVDARLTFKAGSSRDGGLPGISRLVNALLVEGTGDFDAEQIAQTFESTGAQLGHSSLRDMAWVSLRTLSDPALRDKTVDLFARVAALPSFPADAIERDRTAMLLGLAERKKNISNVVEDTFFREVYDGHAYRIGSHGTEQSLKAITRDDLNSFHSSHYVGRNANLALVGDLTLDQARAYATALTRYLKPGQAADPVAGLDLSPAAGKTIKVQFDATQTHILLGMPTLSRHDQDYFALYVGNHILGGSGFSSRLMQEIREDRGLVYSVYSFFLPMESSGPFQMALQTSNDNAEEAMQLLSELLLKFIKEGPSEQELEHARNNITGGFPLKIDSNKKIVDYLALMGFYDMPLDYLDTFNDQILAVSLDDIRDAFKRRVKQDVMTRIIVGDRS